MAIINIDTLGYDTSMVDSSKKSEAIKVVQEYLDNKNKQMVLRNTVDNIQQRLNIQPTGKELLALLGTGNEKNNSDVVRSWLDSQNPTLDQCNASIVDMYAKKLALKLTDIQNYTDW